MNTLKNISKDKSENIMISVSDEVNSIDLGIELPGHTKKELEELKKNIEDNGVEMPIFVIRNNSGGYSVIDGNHRLQICRELGRDCPATILNVSDARAREIALEQNLSRRSMTQDQKKESAYQMRHKLGLSNSKIAKILCVSHVTIGNWLGPVKPTIEHENEQNINNFFMNNQEIGAELL
jgi:ParB/RepB/Spo0J family partition protein